MKLYFVWCISKQFQSGYLSIELSFLLITSDARNIIDKKNENGRKPFMSKQKRRKEMLYELLSSLKRYFYYQAAEESTE